MDNTRNQRQYFRIYSQNRWKEVPSQSEDLLSLKTTFCQLKPRFKKIELWNLWSSRYAKLIEKYEPQHTTLLCLARGQKSAKIGDIELCVVESDFSSALVYTDDEFDIAGIQRVAYVLTRSQSHIRYILEAEMTIEGSENRTNRKKKNFIEDLRDLISLLEENPIDDIQEVSWENFKVWPLF